MHFKFTVLAAAATLALAACSAEPADAPADNTAADDTAMNDDMGADTAAPMSGQEFANMAAASDMYEIEAAKIAIDNTDNADVRELAQMIMTDHQKATADLKTASAAAEPAITVTPAMNADQQSMLDALKGAGDNFDKTYLEQQITAHEKALAMVQAYAKNGDVEALKAHAGKVAGPIEMHLDRARELSKM